MKISDYVFSLQPELEQFLEPAPTIIPLQADTVATPIPPQVDTATLEELCEPIRPPSSPGPAISTQVNTISFSSTLSSAILLFTNSLSLSLTLLHPRWWTGYDVIQDGGPEVTSSNMVAEI